MGIGIKSMQYVKLENLANSLETNTHILSSSNANDRIVASNTGIFEKVGYGHKPDAGIFARWKVKGGTPNMTQAEENNHARQCLLMYALSSFGVNSFIELPPRVRKAFNVTKFKDDMQINDKGEVRSGRPLTMRRINRVKAAVQDELKRMDGAVKNGAVAKSENPNTDESSAIWEKRRAEEIAEIAGKVATSNNPNESLQLSMKKVHRMDLHDLVFELLKNMQGKLPHLMDHVKDDKDYRSFHESAEKALLYFTGTDDLNEEHKKGVDDFMNVLNKIQGGLDAFYDEEEFGFIQNIKELIKEQIG